MSRPRTRTTSSTARRSAPLTPADPADREVRDTGFALGVSVDRLLAAMATARSAEPASAGELAEAGELAKAAEPAEARSSEPPGPQRVVSTTVAVAGMTCRTCENRIARHVGRIPDVERVTASAVHGRVEIESTAPIPPAAIARAIQAAGYTVGRTPWLSLDPAVWLSAVLGIALVGGAAVVASVTGIAGLAAGAGDLVGGGLVVALLLGLAAGVSTCAALVGGLVLALSASFETRRTADGGGAARIVGKMRPALAFIAGRIAGYGLLGAALGALGASITLPPQLTAALMIAAAIVMTILGARLTGLSPRVASWSPTLPVGIGRRLGLADGAVGGYSDGRAAGLGAASFFMPCGFTQAVQVYALSTGSPLLAGAILAVFALGTAPGLLALAGLPVVVPSGWRPALLRLVGVVVLAFAVVNGIAGLRLSGMGLPFGVSAAAAAGPVAEVVNGAQALTTYQDGDGYRPGNVSIYAGLPTRWTVESSTTATCASSLVVPALGISVRLHKGANTIDLPALPAGTVRYSCAMGMYDGAITVVDRPAGSPGGNAGGG
jgi:uncharacterized protein